MIELKLNIPVLAFGSPFGFRFNFMPSCDFAVPLLHHEGARIPNPLSVSKGAASFKNVYACWVFRYAAWGLALLRLSSIGGKICEALPRSVRSFSCG